MSDPRQSVGQRGEHAVAARLRRAGYTLLARNWRHRELGELDIVARQGDEIVFVEVRTRRGRRFGTAEESVTPHKQVQLQTLAEAYCMQAGWDGPVRIDVVAVSLSSQGDLIEINHIQDAV